MTDCTHDLAEQETAVGWDGLCPLCLRTERDEAVAKAHHHAESLSAVLEQRDEAVAALREARGLLNLADVYVIAAPQSGKRDDLLNRLDDFEARLTPKEHAHTADCYRNYNDPANPYCDSSTPKEPERCPTCGSRHPAGGTVTDGVFCRDPWHYRAARLSTPKEETDD